jgi:hypothetical protein
MTLSEKISDKDHLAQKSIQKLDGAMIEEGSVDVSRDIV